MFFESNLQLYIVLFSHNIFSKTCYVKQTKLYFKIRLELHIIVSIILII